MKRFKLWLASLLLTVAPLYAVDKTIAELDARVTLAATDVLECEATGTPGSYKCTLAEVVTFTEGTANSFTLEVDFPGDIKTDVIGESTAATGVTIDGILLKDGSATFAGSGNGIVGNGSATLKIDGNAQITEIGDPATDPVTVTDAGQLHVSDQRISGVYHFSTVLEDPADADAFLLMKAPYGLTITDIDCIVDPAGTGESVVIDIQECDSSGDTCVTVDAAITCSNTGAADDGTLTNGVIDSADWINLDIGTVTGTVTQVALTVKYVVTQ